MIGLWHTYFDIVFIPFGIHVRSLQSLQVTDNSQTCIEPKITTVIQVQRENRKQQAKQASKQSNTCESCQGELSCKKGLHCLHAMFDQSVYIYIYIHTYVHSWQNYVTTYVLQITVCLRVLVLHFFEKPAVHVYIIYIYNMYIWKLYSDLLAFNL